MTPDYFQPANIQDVMRYTKKWPPARGQRDVTLKSTGKLKGLIIFGLGTIKQTLWFRVQ